jgi:hypothetical protein
VSATVLHMSISLDGFVAGQNEGPDNPTGDGGYCLHSWFLTSADGDDFKKVSMGGRQRPSVRRAGGHRGGGRRARNIRAGGGLGWAGDKNVLVHGAATAQLALAAGVLDELELHVIPVLFGQGRRLFDNLDPEQIELERTRILEGENGVTHMHYRVQR